MKKQIKLITTIMAIIVMVAIATTVNAFSGSLVLTSDSKLVAGQEVTVNVKIATLDAGEGIDAIVATLDYDGTVFEPVSTSNFTANNGWSLNVYNEVNKKFTLTKSAKVTAQESILTIKLRVKEGISATTTTVAIKEIVASGGAVIDGGTGDIEFANTLVDIVAGTTPTPVTNTEINTVENTVKENTVENAVVNSQKAEQSENVNKLPQTGEESIMLMVGIVALVALGIVFYRNYKKNEIR